MTAPAPVIVGQEGRHVKGRVMHGFVTGVLLLTWLMMLTAIQNRAGDGAARVWLLTLATLLASRAGLRAVHARRVRHG